MNLCFIDTETTGLPLWREPSDDPRQPHLVQFAALLIDADTREERAVVNLIVEPDGWTIPDEMAAIHGITQKMAAESGVEERFITSLFSRLRAISGRLVAHNLGFDKRIMRIAMRRQGFTRGMADEEAFPSEVCTMQMAKPVLNVAPTHKMLAAGLKGPKNPSLSECYLAFFGEEHAGAHDALADVRACARLYFHLADLAACAQSANEEIGL